MHVYTPTKAKNKHNKTVLKLGCPNLAARFACTSLGFTSITISKWAFVDAIGSCAAACADSVAKISQSWYTSRELRIWIDVQRRAGFYSTHCPQTHAQIPSGK